MGNIVRAGRREEAEINPNQMLATVRAAGVFKARRKESQRKTTAEQIEEILAWKFRRKKDVFGSGKLATVDESQEGADDSEKKFLSLCAGANKLSNAVIVNVGDRVAINDTSVAWNALRESANRDRAVLQSISKETGRLRKIADMIRFVRRSSVAAHQGKVSSEEISYNDEFIPHWENHCHICHSSSTEDSVLNPCRICPRVYHTDCLESRGYLSGTLGRETVKLSTTDIGWSCFNCENLFDLLYDTEKIDIMETFDRMDTNQDSFINKDEFLEYQKDCYQKLLGLEMPGFRVSIEERTFNDMDRSNTEFIDWWEFMIPMCVKKLKERKKRTLVALLTKQEINKIKGFFKVYDPEGEGEISKMSSRQVYKSWYLSLINRPHEDVPVWDWLGTEWIKKTEPNYEQALYQRCDTIKWKDFVSNLVLYILAARPNTGSMRPYIPSLDNFGDLFKDEEDENDYY
ncbi:hypothetical protein ACROYT_G043397 [Oculina patagonica]